MKIDTLDEGWTDKDLVMLHACFQLFMDCIEKEELHADRDWNQSDRHREAKKEIDILESWWKQRIADDQQGKLNPIMKKDQYEQDTQMLIRLILIREFFWT
ncbi:hypothetical protein ACFPQ1_01630 [Rhodocytophaga aerolata]